jgi:hypothetical protein
LAAILPATPSEARLLSATTNSVEAAAIFIWTAANFRSQVSTDSSADPAGKIGEC